MAKTTSFLFQRICNLDTTNIGRSRIWESLRIFLALITRSEIFSRPAQRELPTGFQRGLEGNGDNCPNEMVEQGSNDGNVNV